jgi:hypothetical protein
MAAIKDIRLQCPVYPEVWNAIKKKQNECLEVMINSKTVPQPSKLIQISMFFDKEFELMEEFKSIWRILIDIFRVIILYGYYIDVATLRERMVKVWLSWSYKTAMLPSEKELYHVTFTSSRWCKVVKYKLAAFAAYAKCEQGETIYPKNPLNVPDNPKIILDREFSHWFDSLPEDTICQKLGRMSLIDSICRGVKKGADRATDDDCMMNQIETFDLFTNRKEIPIRVIMEPHLVSRHGFCVKEPFPVTLEPILIDPKMINDNIERSVNEILQGCKPFKMRYNHAPSFSSSTNTSRQKGGHMAEICDLPQFSEVVDLGIRASVQEVLLSNPLPVLYANETGERDPLCRRPLPSSDPDFLGAAVHCELQATKALEFRDNGLGTDLDLDELCQYCLDGESVIRPVALKEALKVRGITTPDALESWLLKPLQKTLSKRLSEFDVFKVTSTPLTTGHIAAVMKKLLPGQKIISGDYDNATNMILNRYTRLCIRKVCEILEVPELLTKVAIRSLCDNVVDCVIQKGKHKIDLLDTQKEAQPMGKVLSFTVLCLLNFTVCRLAYEIDTGIRCPIGKFPGLINGDDVFFPLFSPETWVSCSAMVGLVNSIGKTFISQPGLPGQRCRCFIEMNSRSFIVDTSDLNNLDFYQVPFINFGLMKGLIRSENTVDSSVVSRTANAIAKMGACHFELTSGFDAIYDELDYMFRGYHNVYLNSDLLRGVPFYIPKWLGGV